MPTAGYLARTIGGLMRARTLTAGSGNITITNPTGSAGDPTFDITTNPFNLSGGQLKFPATQSASADANTLDDYEEGTWTPNDQSGAALSFSGITATYVKNGQIVVASATLTYPATASGLGALIGGLPFNSESSGNIHTASISYCNFGAGTTINGLVLNTSMNVYLSKTNGVQLLNSEMASAQIVFTAIYKAAA